MTTIAIIINGKKMTFTSPCSLNQALYAWSTMITGSNPDVCTEAFIESSEQIDVIKSDIKNDRNSYMKCYVIALNQTFVPRNQYGSTSLKSGDTIELLSPMAGG
jgi:thiamine biosynthesis protein ThiS